nr:hypothetical protein CFP56_25713 [Quercus suber]
MSALEDCRSVSLARQTGHNLSSASKAIFLLRVRQVHQRLGILFLNDKPMIRKHQHLLVRMTHCTRGRNAEPSWLIDSVSSFDHAWDLCIER